MQETKVKAIVLGGIDYKEKDMLITLFTLDKGIMGVVFKGVKNPKAKLKSAKEVFSFGDFIYSGSTKIVTSADIIESFYDLTKDIKKYYAACAMLEVIKTVMPQGEANPQVFLLLLKSLRLLVGGAAPLNVLNKFLVNIFKHIGYSFNTEYCNNCGVKLLMHRYMNLSVGDITCHSCRVGNYIEISNIVASTLRLYSITDIDKISTLKIPENNNKETFNLLALNFKTRFNKTLQIL